MMVYKTNYLLEKQCILANDTQLLKIAIFLIKAHPFSVTK